MALRKVELVIQNAQVPGALSDFPVLIVRSNLPNEVVDPSGSNNAQADGGDLKFYSDEALTTRLACEVVSFEHDSSSGAGDAVIEVWVNVPSVSSASDTSVWMSYNEADSQPAVGAAFGRNAVWSDYSAVYHGDDLVDSTGNGHNLTANGDAAAGATGKVGDALTLDGTGDYFDAGFVPATGSQNRSVTAWIKTGTGADQAITNWGDQDSDGAGERWTFRLDENTAGVWVIRTEVTGGFAKGTTDLDDDAWHHVAQVLEGTNVTDTTHYVDGSDDGEDSSSAIALNTSSDNNLWIGAYAGSSAGSPDDFFNGEIDEIRVRTDALSANWITAEFNNQNSPSTFIVEGTPQNAAAGGAATVVGAIIQNYRNMGL